MENILEKEPVIITQATPEDFSEFIKTFPQSEQGVKELENATQENGSARYLLARRPNGNLAGKLYLNFSGVNYQSIKEKISMCPDLENIEVLPNLRGQGIGRKLILEAEKICKEKGYTQVGLGVAIDNPEARKLYESLGYRDTGFGEFDISFMWRPGPNEAEREIHEKVIYLIKNI